MERWGLSGRQAPLATLRASQAKGRVRVRIRVRVRRKPLGAQLLF